jgi:ribosomal protein L11 methyltransferase
VGTGSGILAIAAKLLGAGRVLAVDVDPTALEVAAENAHTNNVEFELGAAGEAIAEPFDVVVANISAQANTGLGGTFAEAVRADGALILSCLLDENVEEVSATMGGAFERTHVELERDWALVEFRRRPG